MCIREQQRVCVREIDIYICVYIRKQQRVCGRERTLRNLERITEQEREEGRAQNKRGEGGEDTELHRKEPEINESISDDVQR